MKVEKTLRCNSNEAFAAIENSLVAEIKRDTHKNVKPKEFQRGYHYNKKIKAGGNKYLDTRVIFKEYERPHCYAADFINSEGTNHVRYEFKDVNEYQCIAVYEETYEGNKSINRANYKLIGWWMALTRKRRVIRTLNMIEKWALEIRKQNELKKAD